MKNAWALQDAKNKFSEVVGQAIAKGPQFVSRHGKDAVVIVSIEDFKKMKRPKPNDNLVAFLRRSPLKGAHLDLERKPEYSRKIKL